MSLTERVTVMKRYTLAIIGSGSLATIIGENIIKTLPEKFNILGVLSRKEENAAKLANKLNSKVYKNLEGILKDKPDYIIEAATKNLVKDIGIEILKNGINFIPLSVGAFADEEFLEKAKEAALENNSRVHIPSGAVGGFDVISAASLMEDVEVSITSEKSPKSLGISKTLKNNDFPENTIEEVFNGSADKAIELFPKNVNVAVATGLVGSGIKNTKSVIKSVANAKSNKHSIKLVGDTINVDVIIESKPSKDNPKSSTLAAYSVIALLKNISSPITF